MRNICLLFILLVPKLLFGEIITIPDAAFKYKLTHSNYPNYHGYDTNVDGEIDTTEALAITTLNLNNSNIHDLTGILYFTNLVSLNFSFCKVAQADLHGLTYLKSVSCDYNFNLFTALNLSGCVALETLYAHSNPFNTLNLDGCIALKTIDIHYSNVPTLDLSSAINLQSLNIENGRVSSIVFGTHPQFTSIKASNNTALTSLDLSAIPTLQSVIVDRCALNQLRFANNSNLKQLNCQNNYLTALDMSTQSNLVSLNCQRNAIPRLDLRNANLLYGLDCSKNQLTQLDINKQASITQLYCSYNLLTKLDVGDLGMDFTYLDCSHNKLKELNMRGDNIRYLDFSYNEFQKLDLSWYQNLEFLFGQNNPNLSYLNLTYNDISPVRLNELDLTNNPALYFLCVDEFRIDFYKGYLASINRRNVHVSADCSYKTDIFPNPSTANFKVYAMDDMITLKIYDMRGTLIGSWYPNFNVAEISIANLATGIYIVEVQTTFATTTHKLYKI